METGRRVEFDLRLQVSPYTVFRRLREGDEMVLVDLRDDRLPRPATLDAALPRPPPDWVPPQDVDVVLFDADGLDALQLARTLQAAGHGRVHALFGGLELWDLALGDFEAGV